LACGTGELACHDVFFFFADFSAKRQSIAAIRAGNKI